VVCHGAGELGVCTDGALSMKGSIKGLVTLVKKKPDVITTHCFLNWEVIAAKTTSGEDLKQVFDVAVYMVSFIKQLPLMSRIFTNCVKICKKTM
jgi:hypothetical protein